MRDLEVGTPAACGDDDRLHGIITRDIVVKCIAEGHDPSVITAQDWRKDKPACVDAVANVVDVLKLVEQYQIRGQRVVQELRLVGMISEADVAATCRRTASITSWR